EPFLKYIWNRYNFDENVAEIVDNSEFSSLCNKVDTDTYNHSNEPKNICIKFLRNLKELNNITKEDHLKRCSNIYYWLYYKIKEHNICVHTFKSIIAESNELIKQQQNIDGCYNDKLYENFDETENLVMLHIFNNNFHVIQELLNNECDSNKCSCKKFIKKCVDSYKHMRKKHCPTEKFASDKMHTCLPVNNFKEIMRHFFRRKIININFQNYLLKLLRIL
ncbi:hypothetical protein PCYB_005600, partial [Plasmodium cynomolgi strain B]